MIRTIFPAVVMWTNDCFHPRAYTYREGFRHCMVFVWTKDGWYGREFRPGQGEIIYPNVADPESNLMTMLGGNHEPSSVELDPEIAKRRANVLPTEVKLLHQWRYSWYRKRAVYHVKWVLGIKAPQITRPFHLHQMLSPTEKTPKKARPVAAVASLIIPAK